MPLRNKRDRGDEPPPHNSACNSNPARSHVNAESAEFQRSNFKPRNTREGIACEIAVGRGPGLASSRRAQPRTATRRRRREGRRRDRRGPWAAAGPGQATHRHPDRLEAAAWPAGPGRASSRRTQPHTATRRRRRGGRRRDLPQCRWAAAGPGRASRRRAERSSRRGRRAGGPPPTGTHSGRGLRRPERQRRHTKHSTGARARRPAPLDATTQTRQLRSTDVPCRSARAARRSRRSSRNPRLRRRAGPRR